MDKSEHYLLIYHISFHMCIFTPIISANTLIIRIIIYNSNFPGCIFV